MMVPPPEGSVLDRQTLNRTLLARQHLLERVARPAADMIEHLVGLQAQVPRDPYISLWSRLRDFDPSELESLLLEREAVRMTLMRTTLHLATARDAHALRVVVQDVCERAFRSSPFARRLEGMDLDAIAAAGRTILDEGPLPVSTLGKQLAPLWPERDPQALAYAVRYLVPLVQVPPRGLFHRSATAKVTTLTAWLGEEPPAEAETAPLVDDILLRYLRAFGPATAADIRTWSWLTGIRAALDRLAPRLRVYRDEAGRRLVDVDEGVFAAPDEPAPVRFTGEYDNVFLAHADRTRITGDLSWGPSYVRQGAFFVDGLLAGAWRLLDGTGKRGRTLALEPRRPLSDSDRRSVADEAEALYSFLVPQARSPELAWKG